MKTKMHDFNKLSFEEFTNL